MKKNFIYGILAIASLGLAACTNDELTKEDMISGVEFHSPDSEYKVFQTFKFGTKPGKGKTDLASRTIGDLDNANRPINRYRLPSVCIQSLTPTKDATEDDINKNVPVTYFDGTEEGIKEGQAPRVQKFELTDGELNLQYRTSRDMWGVEYTTGGVKLNYSLAGTVYFSQDNGATEIPVKLSIFKVSDLESKDQIPLNQFGFGADKELVERHNGTYRGSTFRYISYNPEDCKKDAENGIYLSLPKNSDYDMLKGTYPAQQNLVNPCKDEYFASDDYLVAADQRYVYMLKIVSKANEDGGFYKVRKYPRWVTPGNFEDVTPENISLDRMTSFVNASFMIVDNAKDGSNYYVNNDKQKTIENFKNTYGLDLSSLKCSYAALDGVNTHYNLSEKVTDKYTTPGRLVLWAEGLMEEDIKGQKWNTQPEPCMYSNYKASNISPISGYGFSGKNYSVIFPGSANDTEDEHIYFWMTIDGINVKVNTTISQGIAFNPNTTHEIMVLIPADKFADTVNSYKFASKAISDNYIELELPSDCVVTK